MFSILSAEQQLRLLVGVHFDPRTGLLLTGALEKKKLIKCLNIYILFLLLLLLLLLLFFFFLFFFFFNIQPNVNNTFLSDSSSIHMLPMQVLMLRCSYCPSRRLLKNLIKGKAMYSLLYNHGNHVEIHYLNHLRGSLSTAFH